MNENKLIENIVSTPRLRRALGKEHILEFARIYLPHYAYFDFANFHKKLVLDLMDEEQKRILALMFRESAKSVLCGLVYPLWCICYEKYHFIIYGSEEVGAASTNMGDLTYEMQGNELLISDFGELYHETSKGKDIRKKKTVSDFTTKNDIRVLARGVGQAVRGKRHRNHRPDLFLGDDIESTKNVGTKERRDDVDLWLHSEVLSGMNQVTGKAIIMANLLNFDAVAQRLTNKTDVWITHKVPLMKNGVFAWPERWVNTESEAAEINKDRIKNMRVVSIEGVKRDKGTLVFNQEYMLQPITDEDQIIMPEWIQQYNEKFDFNDSRRFRVIMAVDPAISAKEKADYSAVTVWLYNKLNGNAYCLDYMNKRLSYAELKKHIKQIYYYWKPEGVIVEKVAAQDWLIQDLRNEHNMYVIARTRITDKRSRLISVSNVFEQRKIFFLNKHQVITDQLVNFGTIGYDDLVDTCIDCLDYFYKRSKTRLIKSKGNI